MKREYKSEYRLNQARDYRTDRRRRAMRRGGKWALYILLVYAAYLLQSVPGLLSVFGIKPVWLLGVCVCVATCEGPCASAWLGCFTGLLWDLSAGRAAGFFTILTAGVCFAVSLLFAGYIKASPRNAGLAAAAGALVILLLDIAFNYLMYAHTGVGRFFLLWGLPAVALTGLAAAGVYFVVRLVYTRLRIEEMPAR